jgi:hypothetical protein
MIISIQDSIIKDDSSTKNSFNFQGEEIVVTNLGGVKPKLPVYNTPLPNFSRIDDSVDKKSVDDIFLDAFKKNTDTKIESIPLSSIKNNEKDSIENYNFLFLITFIVILLIWFDRKGYYDRIFTNFKQNLDLFKKKTDIETINNYKLKIKNIKKLNKLKEKGIITEEEFEKEKKLILEN